MKQEYRWLWLGISLVLLFLVFSSPLSPEASRLLQQGWQLGHILLFAVWGYLLLPSLQRRKPNPLTSGLMLLASCVLIGLVIELVQAQIGREFS
jgi:VanZ family protein